MDLQLIMNLTVSLGLFVACISYVLSSWRSGGNKASAEVIAIYKEQTSLQDAKIAELTAKVGRLEGINAEKDKRILALESVDISKNPQMLAFMETTLKVTVMATQYMKDSTETFAVIRRFMERMDDKATTNERANKTIIKTLEKQE